MSDPIQTLVRDANGRPRITMSGMLLQGAGFEINDKIQITYEKGKITITKAE